jgi:hypothetical protein
MESHRGGSEARVYRITAREVTKEEPRSIYEAEYRAPSGWQTGTQVAGKSVRCTSTTDSPQAIVALAYSTVSTTMSLTRISHKHSAASPQMLGWLRQTAHFDPQSIYNAIPVEMLVFLASQTLATFRDEVCEKCGLTMMARSCGASNRLPSQGGLCVVRTF